MQLIHQKSKSKMKENKLILYDPILDRNEKIEEIKKNFYDPKNNLFKLKEDNYKPVKIGNAFSNNYIEYESNGDKDKNLSIKDYLDEIKPCLSDIINDHKTQGEWKIHLTIAINLFSSKDSEEIRTMHSKSDNIEILIGTETNESIEELFKSHLERYQKGLEEKMRGSEFAFDNVDSLYCKLHKISLNRGGSYIYSPGWLKNKKSAINPKNNDDKCFQYALTVALNHEQSKKDPQRRTKVKPFIDQYNLKDIDIPSYKKDWNEFEKSNKTIALNILYVPHGTEEIRHAYKSKHNLKRENQVILLMITDGEKWHYLAITELSKVLKGITSKHKAHFYCLNYFNSFSTKEKLKKHRNVCENHDYCYVEMPEKDNKISKYNYGEKSIKAPFIIYSLREKMTTGHNNPEKSSTTKMNEHTPSGYSFFTHCSFDTTKK